MGTEKTPLDPAIHVDGLSATRTVDNLTGQNPDNSPCRPSGPNRGRTTHHTEIAGREADMLGVISASYN